MARVMASVDARWRLQLAQAKVDLEVGDDDQKSDEQLSDAVTKHLWQRARDVCEHCGLSRSAEGTGR